MGCGATAASTYKVKEDRSTEVDTEDDVLVQNVKNSAAISRAENIGGEKLVAGASPKHDAEVGKKHAAELAEPRFVGASSPKVKSAIQSPETMENGGEKESEVTSSLVGDEALGVVGLHMGSLPVESSPEEQALRRAQYEKRKNQRKEKKKKKAAADANAFLPTNGFLSNVPETDVDIPYRFAFVVMGTFAHELVKSVCDSSEAMSFELGFPDALQVEDVDDPQALSTLAEGSAELSDLGRPSPTASTTLGSVLSSTPQPSPNASPRPVLSPRPDGDEFVQLGRQFSKRSQVDSGSYRCLCPVPYPWGKLTSRDARKFAKLVFRPIGDRQRLPTFDSVLEASSTAFVFVIHVDAVEGKPSLEQQLYCMLRHLDTRRNAAKELRPKWAVILWRSGSSGNDCAGCLVPWAKPIEEFEDMHGSMWRFDTTDGEDSTKANRIYAAFAKIAAQRIHVNSNPNNEHWDSEMTAKYDAVPASPASSSGSAAPLYSAENGVD